MSDTYFMGSSCLSIGARTAFRWPARTHPKCMQLITSVMKRLPFCTECDYPDVFSSAQNFTLRLWEGGGRCAVKASRGMLGHPQQLFAGGSVSQLRWRLGASSAAFSVSRSWSSLGMGLSLARIHRQRCRRCKARWRVAKVLGVARTSGTHSGMFGNELIRLAKPC